MGRRPQDTREITVDSLDDLDDDADVPTAVTNLDEMMAVAGQEDRWTLTVLNGSAAGLVIAVEEGTIVVGRGSECETRIIDQGLSRKHGAFYMRGGDLFFRDLDSTNGSFLDGKAVEDEVRVRDGDRLQLGRTLFRAHLRSPNEVEAVRKLYETSVRDALTGLYNRRHLDERMETEFAYAVRHRLPLSCLVLDIDHFKKVNDTYGHAAGDAVLKEVATFVASTVRTEDVVGRYGGEELVILLRGVGAQGAEILAQRIRAGIEKTPVQHDGQVIRVTASIGVASWEPTRPRQSAEALFKAADDCLYRAKRSGRNLVIADASPRSTSP